MIVQELMELLSKYPADMRVVVDGYENGYDDVREELVSVREVRLNVGKKWWDGRHEDARDEPSEDGSSANVLAIHRSSRYESMARNQDA